MPFPRRRLLHLFRPALLFLLLGVATSASAQRGCDSAAVLRPTVNADLAARRFKEPVPFNIGFTLLVPFPEMTGGFRLDSMTLHRGLPGEVDGQLGIAAPIRVGVASPAKASVKGGGAEFDIGPLRPNERQFFDFTLYGTRVDTIPIPVAGAPVPPLTIPMRIDTVPARDTVVAEKRLVRISARPKKDISNHFDADLAVVGSSRAEYIGVGTNVHGYAMPINRAECTSQYRGWDHLFKRVSLFAGVSVVELDSEADVSHLYASGTPMFGLGFNRLPYLGPLRVNAGVILLRQQDANPLVSDTHDVWDPFLAASFDVELKNLLAPLAALGFR